MKRRWKILIAFLLLALAGFGSQIYIRNMSIRSGSEVSDITIERQLQVMLDSYEWGCPPSGNIRRMFTVTDLDQNGRLELIISRLEGSGQYTYSDYYEVNKELDDLMPCEWLGRTFESEADIMVSSVPVYYDSNNKMYYYIFHDRIPDGIHYASENKRAISLTNGKLSERILSYKNTYDEDISDSFATITCEDADGNEIDEQAYDRLEETIFADFHKREACFSWFDLNDMNRGNLSDNEIADILREAYEGFSVQ